MLMGLGALFFFFFQSPHMILGLKLIFFFNPFWVVQSKSSMCLGSKPKATINDQIYCMSVAMRLIVILAGIPEVLKTFQHFNLVK
jgi:hypothetical protein